VQATHAPAPVLQTGVPVEHCAELELEHCPQAPHGSQAGVAPPHSLSPLQARQVRKAGSHTGVAPPQSALARQPTQLFVAVLQTGVAPEQLALVRHWTQLLVLVSQTGVDPPQSPTLVAEQAPQLPLGSQAGAVCGHSELAPHPRQVCVVPSHTGFVPAPLQSELLMQAAYRVVIVLLVRCRVLRPTVKVPLTVFAYVPYDPKLTVKCNVPE
jgi:hypothetical protein